MSETGLRVECYVCGKQLCFNQEYKDELIECICMNCHGKRPMNWQADETAEEYKIRIMRFYK